LIWHALTPRKVAEVQFSLSPAGSCSILFSTSLFLVTFTASREGHSRIALKDLISSSVVQTPEVEMGYYIETTIKVCS